MRFPSALTVTELNEYIKDLFDLNPPLTDIYIKGEISNYKAHSSGHLYFTLKDEGGALKCVMFRASAFSLGFRPENGMKVTAHGRVSTFVRDGAYQLYCDSMEPEGVGSLYIAYEQLKKKLESEGLFAEERKKPLPKIPSRVGVVTSPTGAAVRDIINVCKRRFPYAEVIVYPALVQGDGAVASVAGGIEYFNKSNMADVLIVGRGGGSIEDLWAFNSELVARAVAASHIPVISAVGHETDFTICDFVADKRAPTPSAAAEIAVPDILELKQKFQNIVSRESAILGKRFEYLREHLSQLEKSRPLASPMNTIEDRRMAVASATDRLEISIGHIIERNKALLASI
ncbi:MAG: exodeoxyribonuclease VII large subunit, partial [Clostridia bacterium]|nr:exodeoxyribonuclease VII large subunit [Clostridia bacterium]